MAAGTSIFTLMGSVLVDNTKANESISKTEQKAEGLASKFMKGMGVAAKWGAAIGGAAIAGGTALFGMANKAADTTDRIDKLSQKIGISRTAFQEYEYILSQNGASIEVMQRGMKTLVDRMDESTRGTGKGAEAFDRLKLSATDLNGELKSQEQMFEESAKALMAMPEGAEKSALAFDLFGKAGQELMPLLNGTAEDMDALKQAANDMGLVLSDEAVATGAKFTDMKDNVTRALGAVVANIGVEVMPMFMNMFQWVMDHMPQIQEIMKIVFEKIGQFVGIVSDVFKTILLPVFQSIYDWVKEYWPVVQEIIQVVFEKIKQVWDEILQPVLTALLDFYKLILEWVQENWQKVSDKFSDVTNLIKKIWEEVLMPVLTLLKDTFIAIVNWVKDNWPTISSVFDTVFKLIDTVWKNVLMPVLNLFLELAKGLVSWIKDNWGTISSVFGTVFDAIAYVWNNVLKPVLDLFMEIIENIYNFISDNFYTMQSIVENAFDGIGTAVEKVTGFFGGLIDKIKLAWEWLTKWNDTEATNKNIQNPPTSSNPNSKANQIAARLGGSFAKGLDYVPYNEFPAILHEGEAVLTKAENKEYNQGLRGGRVIEQTVNIYSPKAMSPSEIARENKKALQRLALQF